MRHLQTIRILDYIFGTLELLAGCAVLAAFFLGAAAFGLSGEAQAGLLAFVFGTFGTVIAGVLIALGALRFIAGSALPALRNWSRIYHIVIAVLGVLSFPFGTAYGIYCIWALLISPEITQLFNETYYGCSSPGAAGSDGSGGFNF